jgi:hypothetical protein
MLKIIIIIVIYNIYIAHYIVKPQNEQSLEISKKNVKIYLFRIAYCDFM